MPTKQKEKTNKKQKNKEKTFFWLWAKSALRDKFEAVKRLWHGTPPALSLIKMSSLPYVLTLEEQKLFQELQAKALMPELSNPGENSLADLLKERQRETQRILMAPYADFLEFELKEMLKPRLSSIMRELNDCVGTEFTAKLFSWYTVQYNETITEQKARISAMTLQERIKNRDAVQERMREIEERGWENTFGMRGFLDYFYDPVKVDRIFRHSDLAKRISLALGPNFYPRFLQELVSEVSDQVNDGGYRVYKKTLVVVYYPFGLEKEKMKKLLEVARSQAKRIAAGTVARYGVDEHGVRQFGAGHKELNIQSVPLLGPSQSFCFCGCD